MRRLAALLLATGLVAAGEPVRLTILHTNDLHGQLEPLPPARGKANRAGGYAHLATLMERIRKERAEAGVPVLLLDAGDLFQGTPIGNETRGDAMVDAMNALRYDAVCVGNHELDYGLGNFLRLARDARFPFLAANVSGRRAPLANVKPFVLFGPPRFPCRVAVIGLLSDRTPYLTMPGATDGLRFSPPADAARALARETDADVRILLTHLGEEEDRAIARSLDGIHLVVGGHSHTIVQEKGRVPVVQAASRGMFLGRVDLLVDTGARSVKVERMELLPVDPDAIPADPAMTLLIRKHAATLDQALKRAVGELRAPLRRAQGLGTASAGNWIADVLREKGGAEIAFMNKGGIRAELEAGPVTFEDVYRVMPFDNTVVAMDLTGDAIWALLERGLREGGHPGLEWSGITVSVDDAEKPRLLGIDVGGRPLDRKATYRVATNSFLSAGGDGFSAFHAAKNVRNTGALLRDALAEALAARSPFTPPAESRLRLAASAPR